MDTNNITFFILNNLTTISMVIGCFGGLAVGYIKLIEYKAKISNSKIHCLKEAPPAEAHGIIFGKKADKVVFSPVNNEGSVGVFSATGTGKTTAVGIPTLRAWTGNSFIIDISGDINKNCPNIKNKLIYEPEDENTMKYNVFGAIDAIENEDERDEAITELVHLISPDDPNLSGAAKFFHAGGQQILMAAFICFYKQGHDFIDICKTINNSSWKELFTAIDDSKCESAISHLSEFDPDRPTDNAGCMQDAKKAISFFATNHKVIRSVGRPSNNEECIVAKRIEDYSIVIIIKDEKLELYTPLLNIIVSQQMQYISSREVTPTSKQVLLFLDEYASLKIEQELILGALRKYRKKLCRIMILTQNLADLEILYGKDATRAILANLKFKLLLGGLNEVDSQKYFAELIGYKDKKKHSTSTNSQTVTSTESENREYVIEPAELDRQGEDIAILLFPSNNGYLKLRKNYYYK